MVGGRLGRRLRFHPIEQAANDDLCRLIADRLNDRGLPAGLLFDGTRQPFETHGVLRVGGLILGIGDYEDCLLARDDGCHKRSEEADEIADFLIREFGHVEHKLIDQDQYRLVRKHGLDRCRIGRRSGGIGRAEGVQGTGAAQLERQLASQISGLLISVPREYRIAGSLSVDPDDANMPWPTGRRQQVRSERRIGNTVGQVPQGHQSMGLAPAKSSRQPQDCPRLVRG